MQSHDTTNDAPTALCECGCGQPAPIARQSNARLGHIQGQPIRFISGHNSRMRPSKYPSDPTQKVKLCECGCGRPAPIAKRTSARLGQVKGQPLRFIIGHHNKVRAIRPVAERFWQKVDKSGPNGCWDWTGSQDKHGYGYLNVGDHQIERAHRVSYELHYGPIPFGLSVLHKCDRPSCTRPDHLFIGTQTDNVQDMREKGRGSTPPRNDVRGERNGHATFTDQEVIDLRREFAEARTSIAAFAARHDVPMVTMWRILRRKNYTHV